MTITQTYIELGANLSSDHPVRNLVVESKGEIIEKFRNDYQNTDVYQSALNYGNEQIREGKQSGPLYFDLDGEYAQADLIALTNFFEQQNCPRESLRIFYSGSKGFHLEVPFSALGIEPVEKLNKVYEIIAKEIKDVLHLPSLDTGIYDAVRLWRLPNSINSKSGLYKIPLTIDEIKLSLEQIKELAKTPRQDFLYAEVAIWEKFEDVYAKAKKRINNVRLGKKSDVFLPVSEGERNNTVFKRAIKLKSEGKTLEETIEICLGIKDNPPLLESEIRRTVTSAFQDKYVVETHKGNKTLSEDDDSETSFLVTVDNRICEEVYDPKLGEPLFAIYDGKEVQYQSSVEDRGRIIKPISGNFVSKNIVRLPKEAVEYGTELELFNRIKVFIHTYVDVAAEWEEWATHYVLLSWVYDKLPVCPYLCALGPSDSGKTRFVQVVGSICYKPIVASGSVTASPIFRLLDQFRGTMIINEFDFIAGNLNDEIIVILNNGFEADLPVMRTEGEHKKEVQIFQVYGPKLFATRKRKNDWAFESRLLTINMKSTKRKDIPAFLLDDFHNRAMELRNMLLMFRLRHYNQEVKLRTDLFTGISGRLRQTLLSITSVIRDEAFLEQADQFAKKLQKELKAMKGLDLDGTVYQVLTECWIANDKQPQLKDIAKKVKEIAELDKLSSKSVGNIVRDELGFKTMRTGHTGNYVAQLTGEQLEALKERYEEEEEPQTTSASSASSAEARAQTEDAEFAELSVEYQEEIKGLTLNAIAEMTGHEGYMPAYTVANKVGCPTPWIKQTLEILKNEGKILQLDEGKDMWSATLATRQKLGFANAE
jgi:hypothetical protein